MKYIGMILGGLLSAIGHMIALIFKNIYISIRRFTMDPANKNTLWNIEAFSLLTILLLSFFWIVGKYQDQFYGLADPVFYRAIPLLIPCFLGHIIYNCPALFKNVYAKPVIQTFLNALSGLALGQILLKFLPIKIGMILALIMVVIIVYLTLHVTLKFSVKSTIFNKLVQAVEIFEKEEEIDEENSSKKKANTNTDEIIDISSKMDLSQRGCLSELRYYSEDCQLDLFMTVPTKEKQSQLMSLNRNSRAQHSQTLGGTGSGKTLLATNLITQDLLNDYMGSTIIEPKGTLINRLANFLDRTGRPYYRLDPQYEHTDCLNPFYVPDNNDIEPMIEANVSAFHAYLGPDAQIYFKSRGTQLMRVGIKALKMVYGNDCGYNELDRLVQPINDDYRAEILSELRDHENMIPLLRQYTRDMAGSPKTREHTMQTYTNLYDYLTELTGSKHIQKIFCGKSTFNIDDVLKNGEIILVNGAYGTLQTLTYTVGRLFLNLLRASTFRRTKENNTRYPYRAHQLTVDELEMFADEEFSTFLEMSREFDVFVNVIHQGNEQLADVTKRLSSMVKQNAVQKFLLAGLENEDVKYYADMIGEKYMIGQSSGTDEMSASGFKTQIKEEKRYIVMPREIANLKGYNPKTGEPGECLFRGVVDNIRLDPVIGIIKPLPLKLFAPLNSEENELEGELEKDDTDGLNKESMDNKLIDIKNKAADRRVKSSQEDPDDIPNNEETSNKTIRNNLWDSEDETKSNDLEQEEIEVGRRGVKFAPATIDETTLKLAEKIKNSTEEKRSNKGNSEEE